MEQEIVKDRIVFGLDIGTTKIVCLAGRLNEHGKLEVLILCLFILEERLIKYILVSKI